MAFSLPDFNLQCAIHTGGTPFPFGIQRLLSDCNLAYGRRVTGAQTFVGESNLETVLPTLLLPPLTDIRDLRCGPVVDRVEVPVSSGRWYNVFSVEDAGKGFANEHRCALLYPISQSLIPSSPEYAGLFWPVPIP